MKLTTLCTAALLLLPLTAHAAGCLSAKDLALEATTISSAEEVTSGKLTPPYGAPLAELPAFCRVIGVLRPTSDSVIRFEVWLPTGAWNSRLMGIGNGGFAGSIGYGQMASALRLGFAVAGTDTGHQAEAQDAGWAYHHPEKVADFGYRGLHLTTLRAKSIVGAVYARAATHAYFDACSDGGREALMEAQRFPEDYDGILAGAPANNWARMLSASIDLAQTMYADPAGYISSMKLPAINRAALAACDTLDGVKDGIVSNPASCKFDPATLLCKDEETLSCLTAPQVKTLTRLYTGGVTRDGSPIFPGLLPGSELPGWPSWITGSGPGGGAGYANNYFRYMVTSDPKWDVLTADPAAMLQQAQTTTSHDLDATDPDLSKFAARGGKMIMYHGWNDPAISPWNSIAYLKSVHEKMGSQADKAVTLYMVPGMEHCAGGTGPSSFGQLGLPPARTGSGILDTLEAWVEHGTTPGPVLTARFTGTGKAAVATTTRPLCPYPQAAKYDGKGDPNLPGSFSCKAE